MDGLQASHARRGAAGQIAAGFQLSVRAHLSPAALVRASGGATCLSVGLSCVTEITRMVFFARVTPLNPTWTGPNAPHALKSAFRATHTTSHSACVAARGNKTDTKLRNWKEKAEQVFRSNLKVWEEWQ